VIDTSGYISTIAGNGSAGHLGDRGPAIQALLNSPSGITCSNQDILYIADESNYVVRNQLNNCITILIATVAGTGVKFRIIIESVASS